MIKVFTANNNGKIELTKEELETMLKESYEEGKNSNKNNSRYTINHPDSSVNDDSYLTTDPDVHSISVTPYKESDKTETVPTPWKVFYRTEAVPTHSCKLNGTSQLAV